MKTDRSQYAEQDNHRNGTTGKTVLTDDDPVVFFDALRVKIRADAVVRCCST